MSAVQLGLFSPRWQPSGAATRRPYVDPFMAAISARLEAAGDDRLIFDEKAWDHRASSAVGVDVEVYRNFFVVCFKRFSDGTRLAFEMSERCSLNARGIEYVLEKNQIISFNGTSYDLPIIYLALGGADNRKLKLASDTIVHGSHRSWEIERELEVRVPRHLDHIDLIEPNPSVRQGLKMLHARLHGRYLVDLPYEPDAILTARQMNVTTLYCHNDLDATELVFDAMTEPLALRTALGREYRTDMRSKSDPQIGEAIIRRRVEAATGRRIERPSASISTFPYEPPAFIEFKTERLRSILHGLKNTTFAMSVGGKIVTPLILEKLAVKLGRSTYSMGIGGLHSMEAHQALRSDAAHQLIDVDVASHYPRIILTLGLYPPALGRAFLKVYETIVDERLAAKRADNKVIAEGLKIAVNGVFGKLGSPYGILTAPHLMIAVTLTGQLSVLMLIEAAELAGISAVSANTDGVLFYCPRDKLDKLNEIIAWWEGITGFTTEQNPYQAIYASSVNSYLAVKDNGKVKRKGPISDPWTDGDLRGQMQKNPQMTICSEAIKRYVTEGTPIERTIREGRDPRMFVSVIKVAGGAVWRGNPIGRIIRYYWSLDGEQITYVTSGNKVPKSDGARPLPEMTDEMPADVDYLRYCEETIRLAMEMGIYFSGNYG